MDQSGEYLIEAEVDAVWQALNDPEVLRQSLTGCLEMTRVSDEQFDSRVKAKIGPVSATFDAQLHLSNLQPPNSYTITANVKGGAAGFGKGTADVSLAPGGEPGTTTLSYSVHASVGGKLAQVGSRLIDGAARKMADDFFSKFGEVVSGETPPPAPGAAASTDQLDIQARRNRGLPSDPNESHWWIWALVFGALTLALVFAL